MSVLQLIAHSSHTHSVDNQMQKPCYRSQISLEVSLCGKCSIILRIWVTEALHSIVSHLETLRQHFFGLRLSSDNQNSVLTCNRYLYSVRGQMCFVNRSNSEELFSYNLCMQDIRIKNYHFEWILFIPFICFIFCSEYSLQGQHFSQAMSKVVLPCF